MSRTPRPIRHSLCLALALIALLLAGCSGMSEPWQVTALHHFDRGNAAYEAEDYANAVRHYRLAMKLDPRSADIHYNLGLAYYRLDEYALAIDEFERALELDPRPEIHYNLALAYHKTYDLEEANRHYSRYRELAVAEEADGAAGTTEAGEAATAAQSTAANGTAAGAAPGGTTLQARSAAAKPVRTGAASAAKPARNGAAAAARPQSDANPFEGNAQWWKEDIPAQ